MSGGQCVNCSDNTSGPHCDACALLYYPQDGVAVNDTNYCQCKHLLAMNNSYNIHIIMNVISNGFVIKATHWGMQ